MRGDAVPAAVAIASDAVATGVMATDAGIKTTQMRIKGKNGAKVRAGVEKDTAEVAMLEKDQIVHAVVGGDAVNKQGDVRVRIVSPVEGYLSAKVLSSKLRTSTIVATANSSPSERMT